MAAIRSYVNGAGGSSGADLAVIEPTYQSGKYWYVGNAVPTADDANDGDERKYPFETLAAGYAAASAGDTVVVLEDHRETISAPITISKRGLAIVGEGSGSSIPRLTNGVAAATDAMIVVSVQEVFIDTFYFPQSSVVARERIDINGGSAQGIFRNLTFECGANDSSRSMRIMGVGPILGYNWRFTAVGAAPSPALEINGTAGIYVDRLVFDGGNYRWNDYALYCSAATTNMRLTRVSQLNGSHFLFPTGSTGTISPPTVTGDSRIDWSP